MSAGTVLNGDIKITGPLPSGAGQKLLTWNSVTGEVGYIDNAISVTGVIAIGATGVSSFTAGAIYNADVNPAAQISLSKLATLSPDRVVITDGAGVITTSYGKTVIDNISSLTGDAQAQINSKITTALAQGSLIVGNGSGLAAPLAVGTTGQVLTVSGSNVVWAAPSGVFTLPPILPSYTVGTVPSAATYTRGLIYVSDETGGQTVAFSDGVNWRRVQDRNIIS